MHFFASFLGSTVHILQHLIGENRRMDTPKCHFLISLRKGIAEHHRGLFDSGICQQYCLFLRCHRIADDFRDFIHFPRQHHRAVSVTVRFDDRDDSGIIFPTGCNLAQIVVQRVQIYASPHSSIWIFDHFLTHNFSPASQVPPRPLPRYHWRSYCIRPLYGLPSRLPDRADRRRYTAPRTDRRS